MLWVVIVSFGVLESISEPPWSFSVDDDSELVLVVLDVVVVPVLLVNLVLLADVLILVLAAADEDVTLLVALVSLVLIVLDVLVVELLGSDDGDIDVDVVLLVVLVVRLLVVDVQVQIHPGEPMDEHDAVQHDNCRVLSSVVVNKTACNNALRWNNSMVMCGCFSLIS